MCPCTFRGDGEARTWWRTLIMGPNHATSVEPSAPVCILMAAYDGERFISQQIESIRRQSCENWRLLIRDDGSSDRTRSISRKFCEMDDRIRLLDSSTMTLGPRGNFEALIEAGLRTEAEWFAFSDQDDMWDPAKLSHHLGTIRSTPPHVPHLACSDLRIIDDVGFEVAGSFLRFQGLTTPDRSSLTKLLMQNSVVGASMFVNRRLLSMSLPFPRIHMHDWWLALLAKSHGQLTFTEKTLVSYRLHGANVCGAMGVGRLTTPFRAASASRIRKMRGVFRMTFLQAAGLHERLNDPSRAVRPLLPSSSNAAIVAYLSLLEGVPLVRARKYIRLPSRHDSVLSMMFWVLCLLWSVDALRILAKRPGFRRGLAPPKAQQVLDTKS